MKHVDINNIDFSDNPVFSHPEDHYFDRQDAYIDLEDSYLIANIRAENARKSSVSSVSSAAGGSFWNLRRILIAIAIIFGLGFLGKATIFLIALISAF